MYEYVSEEMKMFKHLLIVMSLSSICRCARETDIFERNPDNDGKQCLDGERLFLQTVATKTKCAMICRPIVDCKQFFYDASNQTCMGCSSFQSQIYHSSTSQNYVSVNNGVQWSTVTYLGCYSDPGGNDRTLSSGELLTSGSLTVEMCVQFCITNKGYTYAGTEFGVECYCGNLLPADRLLPDSDCKHFCSGDYTQMCGGGWKVSVYTVV